MKYDFDEFKKNFFSFERKLMYACAFTCVFTGFMNIKPTLIGLTEDGSLIFKNVEANEIFKSYGYSKRNILFFDNEKECIEAYNDLIYIDVARYERDINEHIATNEKLKSNFIGTDYLAEKLRRS